MSSASSGSLTFSASSLFGRGVWSDPVAPATTPAAGRSPPPLPPPLPVSPGASASQIAGPPLRPVPLPPPSSSSSAHPGSVNPQPLSARPVVGHAASDDADPSLGGMLVDVLQRREFAVTVASSVVHMLLILLLALFHFSTPQRAPIQLTASVDQPAAVPDLQISSQFEMPTLARGPLIHSAAQPVAPKFEPAPVGLNPTMPKTVAGFEAALFGDAARSGGAEGLDAVSFFNSTVTAQRIVFVVDASTSMRGVRFERAKEELLTAVSNLNSRQRFYVYFFSDKDYPMLAPRSPSDMLPLTTPNWEALVRWVDDQGLVGDTRPQTAMRKALNLKPDVIYLLTDGDFNDDTAVYLMRVSNYKVRINTIGFGVGRNAREVLQQIARKFRGEFVEIE